jgi:subtilisin family serine protease
MGSGRATRLFLALAVAVAAFAGPGAREAASQPGPIPPGARFVPNEVVVQFRPGVSEAEKAGARARANASRKERIRTSSVDGDLELATVPVGLAIAEAVGRLQGHPAVRFAEPNFIWDGDEDGPDQHYTDGSLWGMYGDTTTPANRYGSQAGEAWAAGQRGSHAVYVAVTDHGVNFGHPDLMDNIWTNSIDDTFDGVDDDGNGFIDDVHGWDFVKNEGTVYDNDEDVTEGHGTHVAGTIGAFGGNGLGVAGVTWRVKLIITKYLGDNGGTSANTPKVLDYLIDLKKPVEEGGRHGLNIVASNNSYGGSGYSQAVSDAIDRANKAGILFVASAGNDSANNDKNPRYPSSYTLPNVIAVAAINKDGNKRSSSNWGPTSVDLGAPGGEIISTLATGYGMKSGTSMAAPHVTGAVALYAAANPGATSAAIKDAILKSVVPTPSLDGRVLTNGRLNVAAALGIDKSPPPSITMHVGDLDGTGRSAQGGRTWRATVMVTVHDNNESPVPNASVSGTWNDGASGMASCTTGSTGGCTVTSNFIAVQSTAMKFSVTQLGHAMLTYQAAGNHDQDSSSDGTRITVPRPN